MKLNSLFADHAVFQRDIAIPVWGWTQPLVRVRATLGGTVAETLAGPSGAFLLRLPPQPAGGPHVLVVETPDPTERIEVRDILVGEVWICSGQSNMEMSVGGCLPDPDPADVPDIRMYTVPRVAELDRATDTAGTWRLAVGDEIATFSAAGYYFARRLRRELGVPVGMVNTSWGGTRVEAWMSREALVRWPRTRLHVEEFERRSAAPDYWTGAFGPFGAKVRNAPIMGRFPSDPGNDGEGLGWARPDFDDSAWRSVTLPCVWKAMQDPNNGSYWYRRRVELPAAWRGRDLLFGVGSVDKHDVTYVNGERVGATGKGAEEQFWNVPREYRIPAQVVAGGVATLAVRAFSFAFDGGLIGPAHRMFLRPADGTAADNLRLDGEWLARREHDIGLVVPPAAPMGPGNPNTPHILFDSMVAPLVPYAIRGAIWYQGESNEGNAADYRHLQVAMVEDWRRAWGQGDFPFCAVALASFRHPLPFDERSNWARLREAQLEATRSPGIGLASALDLGDAIDIHPRNKRDVGFRLAQWALAETYGFPVPAMGPRVVGYALETGAVRVRFDHVGSGLVARGGELATFHVAGLDRVFRPATARIEGNTVVASARDVPQPVALRYAWADNPEGCNLYNAEGLPASPFRTDDW